MKIIKYPKFENRVTCESCGCIYEFVKDDIVITITGVTDGFTKDEIKRFFVYCPLCNAEHEIKFKDKENK